MNTALFYVVKSFNFGAVCAGIFVAFLSWGDWVLLSRPQHTKL